MSEPVSIPFDYQALDEKTRQFVQQKADETHGLLKRTAEHIVHIGQNLKAVKEKLPHGQFLPWLEKEFEMSRWTAQHFIRVAEKLEDKWRNFHHLPVSVLYELAAPSTSDGILEQVQSGQIAPTIEAIKAAKEAERLARAAEKQVRTEMQVTRQQLIDREKEVEKKQTALDQLLREIAHLQEQMATLKESKAIIKEVEMPVVPQEVQDRIEGLQQQVQTLKQQREKLSQQMSQLIQEAQTAALKRGEGTQEHRIRQHWYKVTSEFHASAMKLLAQWPPPLDTQAFEADDWTRLSQTKDVLRRLLDACDALVHASQDAIVESTVLRPEEGS